MHSPNYVAKSGSEITEFIRNFATNMLYYQELYQPDRTVFLMEQDDIWRDEILTSHYVEHTKAWEYIDLDREESYFRLFEYDNALYSLVFVPGEDKWVKGKKYTVAELKALDWSCFEEIELDRHILQFTPGYKSQRSGSSWAFKTPKDEYKKHANRLAEKFAPVVQGIAVMEPMLEADDLAGILREGCPDDEIIYITSDSDWHQLGIHHDSKFYNPQQHKFFNLKKDCYLHDFWSKVIGGDKSDNIPGIFIEGRKTKTGETTAKKLVDEHGTAGIQQFLNDNADPVTYKRNLTLISLFKGRQYLKKEGYDLADVENRLVNDKPKDTLHTYMTFGVTPVMKHQTKAQAQKDRAEYYHTDRRGRE
jgi:hypothetical protein